MGYCLKLSEMNEIISKWSKDHVVFAPKVFQNGHNFSDRDRIRYGEVNSIEQIVFDQKAEYSFKEALLPLSQTLFFFTEDSVKEANPEKKGTIIFLRSCDIHSLKRLDEIYLKNGFEDYYYKRLRENAKFVLMGCDKGFDSCFCTAMGTNETDQYDCSVEVKEGYAYINNKKTDWDQLFKSHSESTPEVAPKFAQESKVKIHIPENLTLDVMNSKMWDEYDSRCINCGRCNFVCPTCTCFTMQDIFYTDNGKAGERRRVQASCMVDGFTDVAGGGSYRKTNGQRMRFRVLHKIYDYKKRTGEHMCVGCGRCEDICPEYISFTNCINKLEDAVKEVAGNAK